MATFEGGFALDSRSEPLASWQQKASPPMEFLHALVFLLSVATLLYCAFTLLRRGLAPYWFLRRPRFVEFAKLGRETMDWPARKKTQ